MFGTNPQAWLRLHCQDHALRMAEARECSLPVITLPRIQPVLVPSSAYCC